MDLRIQKTRAAIKSAFLELRRKKPIEKITVTELAKLAEINKATFYLHYSDIYSLADEMEDEVIDDILSEIQGLNKFFDDPRKYTAEMRRALLNNLSTLNSVFSGSRYSGFAEKNRGTHKSAPLRGISEPEEPPQRHRSFLYNSGNVPYDSDVRREGSSGQRGP